MEFVMPILEGAWRYVLTLRVSVYLDIALMAYAIYWLLKLVGTSKVESVGKVILLFLLALMLSDAFSLNGIYFLLSHILSLGALALIVLFQPEIRRLIDQLGSSRWRSFNPFARTQQVSAIENAIAQTVLACTEMSKTRTGVLIVFEREMALDDIARTGTIVDARVSSELLKNIFIVKTTCSLDGTEKSSAAALRQRNSSSSACCAAAYPPRPGELIVRIARTTARCTAAGF